jgi:hypothetical protein
MVCRHFVSNPGVGVFWSGSWDNFRITRDPGGIHFLTVLH